MTDFNFDCFREHGKFMSRENIFILLENEVRSLKKDITSLMEHLPQEVEVLWDDEYEDDEEPYIDVRLQVHAEVDCGEFKIMDWQLHTGDSQYDTDHTGFWGHASVLQESGVEGIVEELLEGVIDAMVDQLHCNTTRV